MKSVLFAVAAMFLTVNSAFALSVANRHNEGGAVGPNGVKQRVTFKIMKDGSTGKDSSSIQVDLGNHKYDSVKPAAWVDSATTATYRPVITITFGTGLLKLTATSDDKGKLKGDFSGKLINGGAGLKLDIKKSTLAALLSDISGKGDHATLNIKIEDNHPPAAAAASKGVQSRHGHTIFELMFSLDISENTKKLTGKG
ncbi:MAG TPA: hypothetical protein VEK08_00960 [Planctomycetota bacterium]|nr:hypothetical protein [Planctomycetota bacterium]